MNWDSNEDRIEEHYHQHMRRKEIAGYIAWVVLILGSCILAVVVAQCGKAGGW